MRLRLGLGFGGKRPGVTGGTAPVITGTPLLTDETISVSGTLPMTFYSESDASSTPLAAAAIKAAPDDTFVLAGGVNYLTGLVKETAAGTWYYNYVVSNAAGDSAVETESYVIASPMEINSFNSGDGFNNAPTILVGPTAAGDAIIICAATYSTATISMSADFTQINTHYNGSLRMSMFRWNGGGTRPNNTNVTVNFSATISYTLATLVIPQATVGNTTAGFITPSATAHTLPTVAKTNRCITLAMVNVIDTVITPTGPGTPPPSAPALPADDGYWSVIRAGNFRMFVLAYFTPDAGGTSTAIEFTTPSSAFPEYIVAAIED